MELTNVQMVSLVVALQQTGQRSSGNRKYKYARLLNEERTKGAIEALSKTVNESLKPFVEEYNESIKDRKLEEKNVINLYGIITLRVPVDYKPEEYAALSGKYKEQFDEVNALMNEKIELNLHRIVPDDIPDDIQTHELSAIRMLIKDDDN